MSCIPKILELKGGKEFLLAPKPYDGIAIEHGGNYRGYDFLITLNDIGIRCGYVAVKHDDPVMSIKDDYPNFNVHGGITFFDQHGFVEKLLGHVCEDKWLGFDCGHWGDTHDMDKAQIYFTEGEPAMHVKSYLAVKQTVHHSMIKDYPNYKEPSTRIRNIEYVTVVCHHLIDQLIEQRKAA